MTPNSKNPNDTLVLLGVIINAHGIKGDVLVRSFTDASEDLAAYGPLTNSDRTRTFELTVKRNSNKGLVCHIAGVDDRNQAEPLKGTELFVIRDQLPKPEDGVFYFTDLIGLKAVSTDGNALGTVTNVMNHGASDILEIKSTSSGKVELIPFLDDFVPSVDLGAGTITIIVPTPAPDDTEDDNSPTNPAAS